MSELGAAAQPQSSSDITEPRELALELHRLLRELDPARWRADLNERARARVARIVELARQASERAVAKQSEPASGSASAADRRGNPPDSLPFSAADASDAPPARRLGAGLQARAAEIMAFVETHLPARHLKNGEARAAWQAFREKLSPLYERFAQVLRQHAIHVPELRPTNYARMVFHAGSALFALALLLATPPGVQIAAAVAFACTCWSLELLRRRMPRLNEVLMRHLGRLAHPHETFRVNSATWFGTGLVVLALLDAPPLSGVGLVILGFADPAAALIGRRFGTIKLVHGRSLQGTLTFAGVGFMAASGLLLWLGYSFEIAGLVALAAAVPAALVELFSRSIDDNLSIPLTAAGAAWLAMVALGLPV